MITTNLYGPYELTAKEIDRVVQNVSPGAYALGKVKEGVFYVSRIGRSDNDINNRLHDYVGDYVHFKYRYYDTKKAAFEKECSLYHDFEPPDNVIHPDRPNGTYYSCPISSCDY
ncbi:MAG: hypothetical protein DWP97_07820 [Calditrichaeota bacterium]|nr:MAG: hypothetical protein DWP97_07820 [Calditrichota bacterium]